MTRKPIDSLRLVPRYNDRDDYLAKTGKQAPSFDSARPKQQWEDPAALGGSGMYSITYWDFKFGALTTVTIHSADAACVNLPGLRFYPPYVPAPTVAVDFIGQLINPAILSSEAEARSLMHELEPVAGEEWTLSVYHPADKDQIFTFGSETRRAWSVIARSRNGQVKDIGVGGSLSHRNSTGTGTPGRWDWNGGSPVFFPMRPAVTGEQLVEELPVPLRALLPNEKIVAGWGGVPHVEVEDDQHPKTVAERAAHLASIRAALLAAMDALDNQQS